MGQKQLINKKYKSKVIRTGGIIYGVIGLVSGLGRFMLSDNWSGAGLSIVLGGVIGAFFIGYIATWLAFFFSIEE